MILNQLNKPNLSFNCMLDLFSQPDLPFVGSDYIKELDQVRLTGQLKAIYELMKDGKYRTLSEIETAINYPQASISANLRNLRKAAFGSHTVNKQRRGEPGNGLFEYQLLNTY